ncbi:MAG: hypothetical protein QOJ89_565 [bacterium]|jgi:hypothetical protein
MRRAMASVRIQRPRAAVHAMLCDVTRRPEYLDHFLEDWTTTSPATSGVGASARLHAKGGGADGALELAIVEVTPRLIAESARGGRAGRRRWRLTYELDELPGDATQVRFAVELVECSWLDRLAWRSMRTHLERQYGQAMLRLKGVLEREPA